MNSYRYIRLGVSVSSILNLLIWVSIGSFAIPNSNNWLDSNGILSLKGLGIFFLIMAFLWIASLLLTMMVITISLSIKGPFAFCECCDAQESYIQLSLLTGYYCVVNMIPIYGFSLLFAQFDYNTMFDPPTANLFALFTFIYFFIGSILYYNGLKVFIKN